MSIAFPRPDRFEPQVIRNATLLVLAKLNVKNSKGSAMAGITIPTTAKPLPATLPALTLIWIRLIVPSRIADIAAPKPKECGTARGGATPGRARRLRMPNRHDAIASPLVPTSMLAAGEASGNVQLQKLQN
jgi:hypothetical protein